MCSDSCEFCLIRIFSAFLHVTSPSYSRHWRCEVSKRPIFRLRLAFVWLHWTVKTNEICIINKYTHTHARVECKRARQSEWIQNLFHGQGRCRTMPKYGIFSFSIQIAFDLYLSKNIHRHFRMLFISFAHAPRSFRRLHPQLRLSVSCFTSIFGTHNNRKIIFVCFESYSRQYTLDHLKKKNMDAEGIYKIRICRMNVAAPTKPHNNFLFIHFALAFYSVLLRRPSNR